MRYASLKDVTSILHDRFRSAPVIKTEKWQGIDIAKKPEMAMHELLNIFFTVGLNGNEALAYYQDQLGPNNPWADEHFEERVCGHPLNPPPSWVRWPFAHSADKFRDDTGQFNHSYPERFWPRHAARTPDGLLLSDTAANFDPHHGIRYEYGDLNSVVDLLTREPSTRQAFVPIFFPEDTGAVHGERIPCSIGFHFIMRSDRLHCFYYIRSCDFRRHFADDVYMAIRLTIWMLQELRKREPKTWSKVTPGDFAMHIGSLHIFRNDHIQMFGVQQ